MTRGFAAFPIGSVTTLGSRNYTAPKGSLVTRIFLTLAAVGTLFGLIALLMGLNIGDAAAKDIVVQAAVSRHMLLGLGGLCFAALVHAIVFTYFMGTGRWIEETSRVYSLGTGFHQQNQKIKYQLLPLIAASVFMLVSTGGFGAFSDPLRGVKPTEWAGMAHMLVAVTALLLNLGTNLKEFAAIERNGTILEDVLSEVRRIRVEKGLPL